jgi:hypothetical protein
MTELWRQPPHPHPQQTPQQVGDVPHGELVIRVPKELMRYLPEAPAMPVSRQQDPQPDTSRSQAPHPPVFPTAACPRVLAARSGPA